MSRKEIDKEKKTEALESKYMDNIKEKDEKHSPSAHSNYFLYALIIVGMWFISNTMDLLLGQINWPIYTFTLGDLINTILLILFIVFVFSKYMTEGLSEDVKSNGKYIWTYVVFLILYVIVDGSFFKVIFNVHALIGLALIVLLFAGYKILQKQNNKFKS